MPYEIPSLSPSFYDEMYHMSLPDICLDICEALFQQSIPNSDLTQIIIESITFGAPLVQLDPKIFALELWHGPSLAFKDFGAQFMARLMSYFNRGHEKELNILVATSGDTGGAVAAGFHNVPGINVIILYPKGKVSPLQEKQLTTFGGNVQALEIEGTFDDCQALVKRAFNDTTLSDKLRLTSANSINIARLVPQMFYYFDAIRQLGPQAQLFPTVFSVPSGNFGNLTAGLFAQRMGLKIDQFVAATNINDVVPQYLKSSNYEPRPSVETLSNAMDVGAPSNFTRILSLHGSTWNHIKASLHGYSYTDKDTLQAIQYIYNQYQYKADPHGAIAYLGLQDELSHQPSETYGIFLETAHPSKFKSTIDQALQADTLIHPSLQALAHKTSHKTILANDYRDLFIFLIETLT
ncbi:UNVERIFIED_CONTAM: hypothetical protein GTU68_062978 [Idotea baltica]|nr:hypothetical protein [Idotea baltica]